MPYPPLGAPMDSTHQNISRMKKILLFTWALPLLAGGCSETQTEPPGPEPPAPTLALRSDDARVALSDGGRAALLQVPVEGLDAVLFTVETNQTDFAAAPEGACDWITLSNEASNLTLTVAPNPAARPRDCRIIVTAPARGGGYLRPLKR